LQTFWLFPLLEGKVLIVITERLEAIRENMRRLGEKGDPRKRARRDLGKDFSRRGEKWTICIWGRCEAVSSS